MDVHYPEDRAEPPALVECDACPRSGGCVETCMKAKVCEHDFEGRAADGGAISMSQPVIIVCAKCGAREEQ